MRRDSATPDRALSATASRKKIEDMQERRRSLLLDPGEEGSRSRPNLDSLKEPSTVMVSNQILKTKQSKLTLGSSKSGHSKYLTHTRDDEP